MKFNTKIKQKIIDKHLSSDWLKAHPGLSTLSLAEISYLTDFSINPTIELRIPRLTLDSLRI